VAGQRGHVRNSAVSDDQLRVGIGLGEPVEVVGDRRQPAPPVDEDGNPAFGGELEHWHQPLVVERKALRPGMELDPARPSIEAADGLVDWPLASQVEADERNQPAVRALGIAQGSVVGRPKRRLAVRLVHAEHERPRDAVLVHDPLELLVLAAEAVDVVAQMEVSIEDLGVPGQQPTQLLVVARDQRLGAREGRFHERSVYADADIGSADG
jgi:hypothetical protein